MSDSHKNSSNFVEGEVHYDLETLHKKSAQGIASRIVSQLLRFVLRLSYQVLIARLLLPTDFGLVAMIGPVIAFIQLFADLGLSQASIQHKRVDQSQLSFMFWLNVGAGWFSALASCLAAPAVAHFFGDERLVPVMIAAGILLGITSLGSQHSAILTRQMRFQSLAVIDVSTFVIGAVAGLTAAAMGASYWAILINQAVTTTLNVTLVWLISGWLPGRPGSWTSMRSMVKFGANFTAFNFVNFFSRNLDNVLIGKFLGGEALGLYDRAFKLMLLPFEQISAPFSEVATTLLSRLTDHAEEYKKSYLNMIEAVLVMLYPGLIFMIVNSKYLISIALGQNWVGIVPIFVWLGIDAFVAPIGKSMGWLMVSQGRIEALRNWALVSCILFVACFSVGIRWGVEGVAASYAAAGLIEICFLSIATTRIGPVKFSSLVVFIIPILISAAVTLIVQFWIANMLYNNFLTLIGSVFAAYITFGSVYVISPRGRALFNKLQEIALFNIRNVFRRKDNI